ncbi:hypothetical protein ARMGADRAFT_1037113 [Armillaria gallica]|uniref:Uncharacterized protein n=1 Tax=Armillaria gallica TaxID=47427 RepID=A0A2H3CMU1_ARMGA|nr:hypothetical protein ARMGADRAFT_1037113 [Armillaria gallica]
MQEEETLQGKRWANTQQRSVISEKRAIRIGIEASNTLYELCLEFSIKQDAPRLIDAARLWAVVIGSDAYKLSPLCAGRVGEIPNEGPWRAERTNPAPYRYPDTSIQPGILRWPAKVASSWFSRSNDDDNDVRNETRAYRRHQQP